MKVYPNSKKIEYYYPITDWDVYNFADCYSSLYMFLEKMPTEKVDYLCRKQEHGDCNFCGSCYNNEIIPPAKMKEDLNFLFQTLPGSTAGGIPWDGVNTALEKVNADAPDFILKYTGYGYQLINNHIEEKIKDSIHSEIPAIAKLKNGNYHIIIGYDNDKLITIKKDSELILYTDEIEYIYIFTGKTKSSYNLCDALKRIKYVMESDLDVKLWDVYINNFDAECSLEELKEKVRKVDAGTTWNVHAFSRAFYLRRLKELKDERLSECIENIGWAYHDSHEARWQAKSMFWCRDWARMDNWSIENGYRTLMQDVLRRIKKDDAIVYDDVCKMIEILE